MQHREEIRLSETLTRAIARGSKEAPALLINELSKAQEIKSILASYDYLNESRGQVNEFTILPDTVTLHGNGEGLFKVTYVMEFFYACDGITARHPQQMTITFQLDSGTGRALFSGEELPEREPDGW